MRWILAGLGVAVLWLLVLPIPLAFAKDVPIAWPIALVLGVVVPLVFLLAAYRAVALYLESQRRAPSARDRERDLLRVLDDRGAITPVTAALRTSLTVDEAAEMLEGLARKGHLKALEQEGILVYTLFDRDHREAPEPTPGVASPASAGLITAGATYERGDEAPEPLPEPLSERELEVLSLLAAGRLNKEIAEDLSVSLGTVKTHTNNLYRKLGARNRAEAIARARALQLL